ALGYMGSHHDGNHRTGTFSLSKLELGETTVLFFFGQQPAEHCPPTANQEGNAPSLPWSPKIRTHH
ncbi:hypothetical protein, partial [Pelagicoccus mobilis]|uniref:hypothetical protein n=1 Tax=Pelagicoccus mobilis TaxID=415221 RepID=UPI0035ED6D1F